MNTHSCAIKYAIFAIDLPGDKIPRRRYLKEKAQLLARGEGVGARIIKRILDAEFGPENVPGERTISTFIAVLNRERESSPPWKPSEGIQQGDDLGFLLRLDLIKRSEIVQMLIVGPAESSTRLPGLTRKEAEVAVSLQIGMAGLDPLIQLLIVHEYAERLAYGPEPITADLDLLIATRPWNVPNGTQLYEEMLRCGTAPQVLVRSLYCTRLIEENATINDPELLIAESDVFTKVQQLILSSNPIMRIQMWAWDALKVPWGAAFDHTDPDSHDVLTGFIDLTMQDGGVVRQLRIDRKKFNWEFLLTAPLRKQDSQTTEQHLSTADSETSND